jgi:transposase-like protein
MGNGNGNKFKEEYKLAVLQSARRGESIQRFCADIGISRQTYYKWADSEDGWVDTVEEAVTIRQAVLLDKINKGAWSPRESPCNNGLVMILARNAGLDVGDKRADVEQAQKPEPLEITVTVRKPASEEVPPYLGSEDAG